MNKYSDSFRETSYRFWKYRILQVYVLCDILQVIIKLIKISYWYDAQQHKFAIYLGFREIIIIIISRNWFDPDFQPTLAVTPHRYTPRYGPSWHYTLFCVHCTYCMCVTQYTEYTRIYTIFMYIYFPYREKSNVYYYLLSQVYFICTIDTWAR